MQRHAMPAYERLVTAEEFARIPDDGYRLELVEGRVVRMSPPGSRHAALTTRITVLLAQHVEANHLGAVLTGGGARLASNPDTVREPDVSFVKRVRIPDSGIPDGFWPGAPDLAVEIRSPGDRRSQIAAKVDDYLARGVSLVWVVDPKSQAVTVHRRHAAAVTLGLEDVLDGGDVVPGFMCGVRRLFE